MKLNVLPVALVNVLLTFCCKAAIISFGEESFGSISSVSKDHFGSRNNIHTTNTQTNRYSRNLYEKPFKRYPFRSIVKPSFSRIIATDSPSLSSAFMTNNDLREDGKLISETTVLGDTHESPKIREKRCGKANAELAKFSSTLKASKQMRAQYGSLSKTIASRSRMKTTYDKIMQPMNAVEANITTNSTNSSNYTVTTLSSSTESTDVIKTVPTTASTLVENANLVPNSENVSQTKSDQALNSPLTSGDELATNYSTSKNKQSTLIANPKGGLPGTPSEDESTVHFAVSNSTTTVKSVTVDSSTTDETETTKTSLAFTSTEAVATESSKVRESDTSSVTAISTLTLRSSSLTETDVTVSATVRETDTTATMTSPIVTSSTETDVTESSTVSETDTSTTETTTSATVTSSAKADGSESSTISETDTSTTETTTSATVTSSAETEASGSSTVSKTDTSTMESLASSSLSISTEVTTEDSPEIETTSSMETTPYSSSTTKETKTTNLRSTESNATLSTHSTEIPTKIFSDSSSEKTTNSSLKTSTLSTAVVTKVTISAKPSEISDMHTTSVVHSTETEFRSSTDEDDWSSTVDELIEKKAALSLGKIAWIVIGILMVLTAFSGGIFFGHRYRTVYQKREDTIALVVRNQNHRSYY